MDQPQSDKILEFTKAAFDTYEKSSDKIKGNREQLVISTEIKSRLDQYFGPNWFAIVGEAYAASFTQESKSYWHFFYRKNYITVFRA